MSIFVFPSKRPEPYTTYATALRLLAENRHIDAFRVLRAAGMDMKAAHETLEFLCENIAKLVPDETAKTTRETMSFREPTPQITRQIVDKYYHLAYL
jgi:hypothetical protein